MIFVDEARISVKAGDGGQGCESYYRDLYMRHKRPDGGDGGRGGDVLFIADRSIQTLLDFKFKQHFTADKGGNASSNNKTGKNGKDYVLRVPIGTILKDSETGLTIKDLDYDGSSVVVAKGGRGGFGNQNHKYTSQPEQGEARVIELELKLVADAGLIGFPNAGKSTIISGISKVRSKIANYPFTTKKPILGIVPGDDFDFAVADLPGIIEGAHEGKGLGHQFLRHAERTKILVHVLDMSGSEGRDPLNDFEKLNYEIAEYNDAMAAKEKIIVANKMDLPDAEKHLKRFRKKYKYKIFPVSAAEGTGFEDLVEKIRTCLCKENFQKKLSE